MEPFRNANAQVSVTLTQEAPLATVDWAELKQLSIQLSITGEASKEILLFTNENKEALIRLQDAPSSGELEADSLVCEIQFTAKEKPLLLSVPWSAIA